LSYLSRVLSYLATRKPSLLASAGCAVPGISMSDISIHSIAERNCLVNLGRPRIGVPQVGKRRQRSPIWTSYATNI
jgi:hypothetical protein